MASEPSRSARSLPTRAPCWRKPGPRCLATMTFAPSPPNAWRQTDLFGPTPYAAGSPARTSARRARALASKASVPVSGARCADLFPSADPVGSLLRTSLLSELAALTGFSGTWKRSATPAGRSWWVLPMPEHPIGEGELGYLPTPTMADAKGVKQFAGGNPSLSTAVRFLPTPCASNTKSVHLRSNGRPAKSFLPTLTASIGGSNNASSAVLHHGHGTNLIGAVRLLPTLASRDWRYPNSPEGIAKRRAAGMTGDQLPNVVGGPLNPTWCEWLMGFPLGWTELPPSATPSSRKSSKP